MLEVLSIHFPKAGGSSVSQALTTAYGDKAIRLDYSDDPANPCSHYVMDPDGCRARAEKTGFAPEIKVVHGHYHVSKYDFVTGAKRITFLRHPVDTVISIYYFWKTCEGSSAHALFKYAREHNLGLMEIARLPAIRYLLSRTYFGGVDMDTFCFIGFMDSYSGDVRRLSTLLSVPIVEQKENTNQFQGYRDEVARIKSDTRLMSDLQDCLIEDIRFYEKVRAAAG